MSEMDYSDSVETANVTIDEENVDETESPPTIKNPETSTEKRAQSQQKKFIRLPLTRIKHIMKLDPECHKVSQDSVYLVTKATELFLEYLGRESAKYSQQGKRKTVQRRDVDAVISGIPQLCFLEGALE